MNFGYRPVQRPCCRGTRAFGDNPGPSHLFNVILYGLNILLLYIILRRLLPNTIRGPVRCLPPVGCSPLASEWCKFANREEILSFIFALISVGLFLSTHETECLAHRLQEHLLSVQPDFQTLHPDPHRWNPAILYFFTIPKRKPLSDYIFTARDRYIGCRSSSTPCHSITGQCFIENRCFLKRTSCENIHRILRFAIYHPPPAFPPYASFLLRLQHDPGSELQQSLGDLSIVIHLAIICLCPSEDQGKTHPFIRILSILSPFRCRRIS
jgi:hypothetical protein